MSLDVYLNGPLTMTPCTCQNCGNVHEHETREELFWANITHNLGRMAKEAGIYSHLWRPEEIGIAKAAQLIEPLQIGLALLKSDPTRFKAFDDPGEWGTYEQFVPWLETYLVACKTYPAADVSVSR